MIYKVWVCALAKAVRRASVGERKTDWDDEEYATIDDSSKDSDVWI